MKNVTFVTKTGRKLVAQMPDYVDDLVEISEEEYDQVAIAAVKGYPATVSVKGRSIKAMYQEDIEGGLECGCGTPGCTEKAEWIHQMCHTGAGLNVKYDNGILNLYCSECGKLVMDIHVASKTNENLDKSISSLVLNPVSKN